MSVRVSVVIPCYKCADWIEATLESVVKQTYSHDHLEIIVVDDASPDDSGQVASRFLEKQSVRSRVVRAEKNAGLGATRNVGWKLASGDWIQFLDADDLLAPHKLELQASVASSAPDDVAVVYSQFQHFSLVGDRWQPSGAVIAPFVDEDPVVQILHDWDFGYVGPTIVRKSWVERVAGFEEGPRVGEDCDLMLRMAMAGARFRVARADEVPFFYRQTPNSLWRATISQVVDMRRLLVGFRGVEEFLRARSPAGLSDFERLGLASRYSRFADIYLDNDPEGFRLLMGWLQGLGYRYPTNLTPRLRALSNAIGYDAALRLRAAFRRVGKRFR